MFHYSSPHDIPIPKQKRKAAEKNRKKFIYNFPLHPPDENSLCKQNKKKKKSFRSQKKSLEGSFSPLKARLSKMRKSK